MLVETPSAGRVGSARWGRASLAAAREHPAAATLAALIGLAATSAALRAVLVGWAHGPFVFMDELGYERMALSFAHTGHFSLFGRSGLAYWPLYPIFLSPIYALTSSMHAAYDWAKVENAVLISMAVFPIYAIARSVLPRGRAVGVAALSLLAPLMLYSGFEMSESLAYPLCLAAIWTMLRAVRRPGLRNDAILLAAIALASAARVQQVALVPAALTAVLLAALARPESSGGRMRAALRAISQHRLLFGAAALAVVAALARMALTGGKLPLERRYANVGGVHASPLRLLELFFQHLAELDFAVGVIPFAAALLTGYALIRSGFPRRALVFASVAVATTVWMLLGVAYEAATIDATTAQPRTQSGFVDLPRIHERYLIYLVPFFFVALVAALPVLRSKVPLRRHLLVATAAALLPILIPFGTVINGTSPIDSFALQAFGTTRSGRTVPIAHPTLLILSLSALLTVVYLLASSKRLPPIAAVAVTAVALLGMSTLELGKQVTPLGSVGLPAHANWVDEIVGSGGNVSLLGGTGVPTVALRETAFWNESITRIYYTCRMAFGPEFGEQQPASGVIHTAYAVVPMSFDVSGRVLARDPVGKLVLVATSGGVLKLPPPNCPTA